ncbi:MAG TPA: hypothetical protein VG097_03210 [Gemmata sp.]|nr:hypothetical protein [Gemmata sp.]
MLRRNEDDEIDERGSEEDWEPGLRSADLGLPGLGGDVHTYRLTGFQAGEIVEIGHAKKMALVVSEEWKVKNKKCKTGEEMLELQLTGGETMRWAALLLSMAVLGCAKTPQTQLAEVELPNTNEKSSAAEHKQTPNSDSQTQVMKPTPDASANNNYSQTQVVKPIPDASAKSTKAEIKEEKVWDR